MGGATLERRWGVGKEGDGFEVGWPRIRYPAEQLVRGFVVAGAEVE